MTKQTLCWLGLAVLCLGSVRGVEAMSVEETDFDRLLEQAEQIYKARVVSVSCDWSGVGANRHVATFVRLQALESYRGGVSGEQTLEFFGGTIGDLTQRIVGMPEFQAGDVEILFVRHNHRTFCPLVGANLGRMRVVKNAADGREQIFLDDGTPLTSLAVVGKEPALRAAVAVTDANGAPTRPLPAKEFAMKIRDGLQRRGIAPDAP